MGRDLPIMFSPSAIIVPDTDVLYVVSKKGTFNIRSKNIHLLHQVIQPYVTGTHSEQDLVEAVAASNRESVFRYLAKLREVGAVEQRRGATAEAQDGPAHGICEDNATHFHIGSTEHSICVSLGGIPECGRRPSRSLAFVTAVEAGRGITRSIVSGNDERSDTYVVIDANQGCPGWPGLADLRLYAQWLIGGAGLDTDSRLLVYRLDGRDSLRRVLAIARGDAAPFQKAIEDLNVVHVLPQIDQVPLVVAQASHAFWHESVTRIGLRYPDVQQQLAREFFVRSMLAESGKLATLRYHEVPLGGGPESAAACGGEPIEARKQGFPCLLADSFLHLSLLALEQHLSSLAAGEPAWSTTEVDLLTSEFHLPDIRFLQNLIGLRRRSVRGQLQSTCHSLYRCLVEGRTATSVLREKAVRDVLLGLVWEEFYRDTQLPAAWTSYDFQSFRNEAELKSLLCSLIARLEKVVEPRLTYHDLSTFGVEGWIGRVDGER